MLQSALQQSLAIYTKEVATPKKGYHVSEANYIGDYLVFWRAVRDLLPYQSCENNSSSKF